MHNVLKYYKNGENNDKNQFTVTVVQPHRNRKYFQLNNAYDCSQKIVKSTEADWAWTALFSLATVVAYGGEMIKMDQIMFKA